MLLDTMPHKVDVQWSVVEGSRRGDALSSPPAQCSHASHQLALRERLDQVVVHAAVESANLVALGPQCSQAAQPRRLAHHANTFQHLPAIELGQPHVEDDDVRPQSMELARPGGTRRFASATANPARSSTDADEFAHVSGVWDQRTSRSSSPMQLRLLPGAATKHPAGSQLEDQQSTS